MTSGGLQSSEPEAPSRTLRRLVSTAGSGKAGHSVIRNRGSAALLLVCIGWDYLCVERITQDQTETDGANAWRSRATTTVEQAGHILGISRGSAYQAAHSGELPTINVGRRMLVPVVALRRKLGEVE